MKILAFDTSTPYASLALWNDDHCVYDATVAMGRRHSELLFDAIDHALGLVGWERQALEAIAVGIGPGSFTGLRVGVATAQGLAFALNCPLFGVNSLDAMSLSAPAGPALLATCLDARKQEVYVGVYRRVGAMGKPESLGPTRLLKPAALAAELAAHDAPVLMVGSGVAEYRDVFAEALGDRLQVATHGVQVPRAADIAYLAREQDASGLSPAPFEVLPLYIRPSEAEMHIGPPEGGPPLADRLSPDGSVLPASGGDKPTDTE